MRSLLWEWVSRYPAASILATCDFRHSPRDIKGPERLGDFLPHAADHTTERTAANGGTAMGRAGLSPGGGRILR